MREKEVIFKKVEPKVFGETIKLVRDNDTTEDKRYQQNLDLKGDYDNYDCYLSTDHRCGFCIDKKTGELCNVFNLVKGRGKKILEFATSLPDHPKLTLNCFDKEYLVNLYKSAGFKETKREKNWTDGEPDVVYMEYSRVQSMEISDGEEPVVPTPEQVSGLGK